MTRRQRSFRVIRRGGEAAQRELEQEKRGTRPRQPERRDVQLGLPRTPRFAVSAAQPPPGQRPARKAVCSAPLADADEPAAAGAYPGILVTSSRQPR